MSLINDALRRANQQKNSPTPEKSDGTPMQPVHSSNQNHASFLGPILLVLIVLILMLAAFFFWKGMQTKKELSADKKTVALTNAVETVSSETKLIIPATPPTAGATAVPPSIATNESTNPAVASPATATNPVPPAVDPGPPPLKLQGIFYRPSNPTVMINGKTVGIGELVSGARVISIERQEVTVERDGKTEILRMD